MNYDLLTVERCINENEEPRGEIDLKELNGRHELVVLLYLDGIPPKEISSITGYNQAYVSRIVKDPLAKALIKERITELDEEFQVLYKKSIDAIRDGLDANDIDIRLKAAEKYLRAHGKYGTVVSKGPDTAEDVIKRILELKVTEIRPASMGGNGGSRNA